MVASPSAQYPILLVVQDWVPFLVQQLPRPVRLLYAVCPARDETTANAGTANGRRGSDREAKTGTAEVEGERSKKTREKRRGRGKRTALKPTHLFLTRKKLSRSSGFSGSNLGVAS